MEFVLTNWLELFILVLFFIAIVLFTAWQIKKNGLRSTVVKFIVKAEDMYNQGANQEKLNYVIDRIIGLIPMPFNLFITRLTVQKFIQKIFDEVKEALDYKKIKY